MGDVHYTFTRKGRKRLVGNEFVVPAWFTVEVDDPALDFLLELDVDNSGGQPACAALVAMRREEGPPITAESLRAIRLATYLREASAEPGYALRSGEGLVGGGWPLSTEDRRAYLRARRREERQGRRRITTGDLRLVAEVYRKALRQGEPPTSAVERALHLQSRAQAARWVAKAREANLLGPAPGHRRAGEMPGEGPGGATESRPTTLPTRSTSPRARPPEVTSAPRAQRRRRT